MGRRGPAPAPTVLRILHGERKDRLNPAEPIPRAAPPVCPDDVSAEVRAVWDETLAELDAMHVATAADRDALRCFCEAVVTHRKASALLAGSALLIKGQKGNLVRNPVLAIQRDAAHLIRQFAQEFGLTPSARSRIEVKGSEAGGESNPFAGAG